MKVLGPFMFDQRPSSSPWGWTSGWGDWNPRFNGLSFDRWREPPKGTSTKPPEKVYEIPIQIEGASRHTCQEPLNYQDYSFSDEDSDSDYDWYIDPYSYNWNNNGTRIRRKRRRSCSTPRLISSKDTLQDNSSDPAVLESDKKTKESTPEKKVPSHSGGKHIKTEAESSGSLQRALRSGTIEIEKPINDTSSYEVYSYLKALLLSTERQIDAIKGDGNCLFRALSKIIYGAQGFYDEMRQAVVDVLEKYPKQFEQFADEPMKEHIAKMRLDKTWATQTEIYAAATLLQRDIYILSPDQCKTDCYRWLLFSPLFHYSSDVECCRCYLTLCHTHGNHYDRIAPIEGECNCDLPPPEMSGVKGTVDLTTTDENEIV